MVWCQFTFLGTKISPPFLWHNSEKAYKPINYCIKNKKQVNLKLKTTEDAIASRHHHKETNFNHKTCVALSAPSGALSFFATFWTWSLIVRRYARWESCDVLALFFKNNKKYDIFIGWTQGRVKKATCKYEASVQSKRNKAKMFIKPDIVKCANSAFFTNRSGAEAFCEKIAYVGGPTLAFWEPPRPATSLLPVGIHKCTISHIFPHSLFSAILTLRWTVKTHGMSTAHRPAWTFSSGFLVDGDEDWKEDDFFSSCGSLAWSHITQSSLSTANKLRSLEMELMIFRNISAAAFPNTTTIFNDWW